MKTTVTLSPEALAVLSEHQAPHETLDDVILRLAMTRPRAVPRLEDDESAVC